MKSTINRLRPEVVMIEMSNERSRLARLNETFESLNPVVPSFEREFNYRKFWRTDPRQLLCYFISNRVRTMYDKLDDKGLKAGGEFTAAIDAARNRLLLTYSISFLLH